MPQCARLSRSRRKSWRVYFLSAGAAVAPALASFMHSRRNFLRSLPFNALASACLEHSSDPAERSFGAFLSVVAAASVLAAGAAVCAKAVPVASREARATTARRDEKVMVVHSSCGNCEGRESRLALLNAT